MFNFQIVCQSVICSGKFYLKPQTASVSVNKNRVVTLFRSVLAVLFVMHIVVTFLKNAYLSTQCIDHVHFGKRLIHEIKTFLTGIMLSTWLTLMHHRYLSSFFPESFPMISNKHRRWRQSEIQRKGENEIELENQCRLLTDVKYMVKMTVCCQCGFCSLRIVIRLVYWSVFNY